MAAPDSAPPIDPQQVAALRASMSAADFATLRELVTADFATRVARLRDACGGSPDRGTLAREAHQLLGSARNIGAGPLAEAAQRLEDEAGTAPPAALRAQVDAIASLADAADAAFAAGAG